MLYVVKKRGNLRRGRRLVPKLLNGHRNKTTYDQFSAFYLAHSTFLALSSLHSPILLVKTFMRSPPKNKVLYVNLEPQKQLHPCTAYVPTHKNRKRKR